jgi:hypothetical protein
MWKITKLQWIKQNGHRAREAVQFHRSNISRFIKAGKAQEEISDV